MLRGRGVPGLALRLQTRVQLRWRGLRFAAGGEDLRAYASPDTCAADSGSDAGADSGGVCRWLARMLGPWNARGCLLRGRGVPGLALRMPSRVQLHK